MEGDRLGRFDLRWCAFAAVCRYFINTTNKPGSRGHGAYVIWNISATLVIGVSSIENPVLGNAG